MNGRPPRSVTPRVGATLLAATLVCACRDAAPGLRSPIATLAIQPADSFLLLGHARQLLVVSRDAAGQLVPPATVAWTTSAPEIARVDATGLVSAPDSSPGGVVAVLAIDTAGMAADTVLLRVVRHGEVKWRLALGFMPLLGGPAQGPDGTLYVLGAVDSMILDATLYAVSPAGAIRWQRRISQVDYGNYPLVGVDGSVFVVGQYIWAFTSDGTLLWSLTTRPLEPVPNLPDAHAAAVASDGALYAALGKDLLALDAATGDTLWEGPRAPDGGWLLPPSVSADGRTAYIKHTGDVLYAFDGGTGSAAGRPPIPHRAVSPMGSALRWPGVGSSCPPSSACRSSTPRAQRWASAQPSARGSPNRP